MSKKKKPSVKGKNKSNHPETPRKISAKEAARLKQDLADLGDLGGIVHDVKRGKIVGGHQRLSVMFGKNADGFNLDTANIVIQERYDPPTRTGTVAEGYITWERERYSYRQVIYSDKQFQRANIVANLRGGTWDWDELTSTFDAESLMEWGFGKDFLKSLKVNSSGLQSLLNKQEEESHDAEPQIDRAAELLKKWKVKTGDLWQIGDHKIICGDSCKREDVYYLLGDERAEMVFSDPPYGVAIGDKNKFLNSFQPSGRNLENIAGDLMGKDELFDMLVLSFTLTHEIMKDCCAIYVTAPQGGELGLMMMMMMMMSGLPVRHVLNWIKNSPTFSMGRLDYDYQHEPILFTWKKSHKHYGAGKYTTSTWFIDKPRASKEHPTMKPVELVENALLNSSLEGQIIYDPFSGSGTTTVACENLSRQCRSVEISPAYVAVTLERMATAFPGIDIRLLSSENNPNE